MVKKLEKEEVIEEAESVKADPRVRAWEAFVANYAIKNPVKYAAKKARGEFDKIPATFK